MAAPAIKESTQTNPELEAMQTSPEVVWGAAAIGKVIGEPNERKCYYRLEQGMVPGAKKFGRIWALSIPAFRREMHGEAA